MIFSFSKRIQNLRNNWWRIRGNDWVMNVAVAGIAGYSKCMATGIILYKIISVAALAWEMIWLHLLLLYECFWSYIYGSVNSAIDLWLDTVSRNITWNENGSFMGLYYVFCFIPRWWKSISRSKFWSGINVLLLGICFI